MTEPNWLLTKLIWFDYTTSLKVKHNHNVAIVKYAVWYLKLIESDYVCSQFIFLVQFTQTNLRYNI